MRKKEQLFTVPEAAEEIGVSAYTVYRWLNSGKLAGYKLSGSKWQISETHINDFYSRYEIKEVPLKGEED